MSPRFHRRRFLKDISMAMLAGSTGLCNAEVNRGQRHAVSAETSSYAAKRVFMAGFAHETNTFHPLPTTTFTIREPSRGSAPSIAAWKDTELDLGSGYERLSGRRRDDRRPGMPEGHRPHRAVAPRRYAR